MVKNYPLNFAKGIACLLVVLIHCPFPSLLGDISVPIARVAVPIFLMISGYFCFYPDENIPHGKIKKKTYHILKIFLFSALFYIVVDFIRYFTNAFISHQARGFGGFASTLKWLLFICKDYVIFLCKEFLNLKFILLNYSEFILALWFLLALLYTYLIFGGVAKIGKIKIGIYLSPIFIIANIVMSEFLKIDFSYINNFIFFGIPFFFAGYFIHKKQPSLTKLPNRFLCILALFGLVCSIFEGLFIAEKSVLYIGTIVAVFSIFILCIKNGSKSISSPIERLGEKYSLFVYVLHIFIIKVVAYLSDVIKISDFTLWGYLKPITVIVLSVAFSIAVQKLIDALKYRKKQSV